MFCKLVYSYLFKISITLSHFVYKLFIYNCLLCDICHFYLSLYYRLFVQAQQH